MTVEYVQGFKMLSIESSEIERIYSEMKISENKKSTLRSFNNVLIMVSAIIIYILVLLYNYMHLNLNHIFLLPPIGPLLTIGAIYVYNERVINLIGKKLIYLSKRYEQILSRELSGEYKKIDGQSGCSILTG